MPLNRLERKGKVAEFELPPVQMVWSEVEQRQGSGVVSWTAAVNVTKIVEESIGWETYLENTKRMS